MGDGIASGAVISCDGCGKQYRWKPELAGRKVRCACGFVMVVADAPAVIVEKESEETEEDSPDEAAAGGAAVEGVSGEEFLGRLGYAPSRAKLAPDQSREETDKLLAESAVRDIVLPILLIVGGTASCFYEALHATKHPAATVAAAIPGVLTKLGLSVGLMLLGLLLATTSLEITFIGSFKRSILKLCGIAIGPAAIYGILSYSMGDLSGSAAGVFGSVAAYWLLFYVLMKLDLRDTTLCVILIWVLVTAANYVAYKLEGIARNSWM